MDRKNVELLNALSSMSSSSRITSNSAMVPNQKSTHVNQSQSSQSRHTSGQSSSQRPHSSHSSQVVYTPRLKKVLKSYQASATTSLNGPDWPHRVLSLPSSPSSSSSSVSSPLSSLPPNIGTPPIPHNSFSGNDSKGVTKCLNQLISKNSDSMSRSTIDSNRFVETSSRLLHGINRNKNAIKDNNGLKGQSYDPFLAPPPFPIQQPPIFTPPDQNRCERSETILEGETISCFTVGGEKRLCLPQILTTVLRDFSLPQINSVCDDLQIFCSRCTTDQLEVLKMTAVIPASAPSCGLITKTDAERLCATLLYSNPPKASISLNAINGKQLFTFKVYHHCFGKCIGLYVPALYVQPFSTCIECLECHGLFAPQKFVCHSHHSRENRTCHWGFDSSNWRAYLLVAKDKHRSSSHKTDESNIGIEEHLIEMKSRFDFKRKIADSREEFSSQFCDSSKRIKCEETSNIYPSYLFSPYGWAGGLDPSLLMYWYPALASGVSGGNNSSLAARLSAFKPWSANTLGNGRHLPQNLLQCMPQGLDRYLQTNKCVDSLSLEKSDKIGSKRSDRYVEPSVGSAPLKTYDSSPVFIAQKPLKSDDKEIPSKDKTLYDDDSFNSNPTLGSENSNYSDEENTSEKNKSEKIFANLELILDENNLSKELKVKIISEVQIIINKLSSVESMRPTLPTPPTLSTIHTTHKKKILNEIQDKKSKESLDSNLTDVKKCEDLKTSVASSLGPGVSSCSPTLIKQEPNSSPLLADSKLNCVH